MNVKILLVVIVVFLLGSIGSLFFFTKNSIANDFTEDWSLRSKLIALQTRRGTQDGMLFLKLRDGDEHFFPGDWSIDFGEYAGTFVYGRNPEVIGQESFEQFYYLAPNQSEFTRISLGDQTYSITKIQENKKRTYFFVEYSENGNSGYCVAERLYDVNEREAHCGNISTPNIVDGMWNPEKDHEVIIKLTDTQYYLYDPWEEPVLLVNPEDDRFKEVDTIYTTQKKLLEEQDLTITQLGPFIHIPEGDHAGLYRVPLYSEVSYISDNEHLLVKSKSDLYILELKSRTLVHVLENNLIENHTIYFRGINGANSL